MGEFSHPDSTRLALHDALELHMLRRATGALEAAGVPVLLFKGAALARTVYAKSWMRGRADADALIPQASWRVADRVLADIVGARLQRVIDPRVMGQWQYRDRQTGLLLDVHWRLFEAAPLATLVGFDELFAASVILPGLEPVRGPGLVHTLWIAILHPVAHHGASADPIWDDDLRRISAMFSAADWHSFAALAARTGTSAICRDGLARADVAVPAELRARLDVSGEPTARMLNAGRATPLSRHLSDLAALPGWRARLAEGRRRLFPPGDYMRSRYGPATRLGLVPMYARRIATGLTGSWRVRSRRAADRFSSSE